MPKPQDVIRRHLREKVPHGKHQKVATAVGVNPTTISRWKRDDYELNMSLENLVALADVLGLSVAELVEDAGDRKTPSQNDLEDLATLLRESLGRVEPFIPAGGRESYRQRKLRLAIREAEKPTGSSGE